MSYFDLDRDSTMLVEAFYARIESDLRGDNELPAAIRERQAQLTAETTQLPDEPARYNLRYTSSVLAAFQVCHERGVTPPYGQELIEWLKSAFNEPCAEQVGQYTRMMLDNSPDPFAAMTDYARDAETEQYGAQFRFAHSADDQDRLHIDVHRCGYHDFFTHHDAGELTPVMCAFDANWYDAIDPPRHGLTFTRETTIGHGGQICPFHFRRYESD